MRRHRLASAFLVAAAAALLGARMRLGAAPASLRVGLTVAGSVADAPLDGRMLLLVSRDNRAEPRFQITDGDRTAQVFGVDVEGLQAGREVVVDGGTLGYPVADLADLKAGDYWV